MQEDLEAQSAKYFSRPITVMNDQLLDATYITPAPIPITKRVNVRVAKKFLNYYLKVQTIT